MYTVRYLQDLDRIFENIALNSVSLIFRWIVTGIKIKVIYTNLKHYEKMQWSLEIATDLDAKLPQVNFVNDKPDFFSHTAV